MRNFVWRKQNVHAPRAPSLFSQMGLPLVFGCVPPTVSNAWVVNPHIAFWHCAQLSITANKIWF